MKLLGFQFVRFILVGSLNTGFSYAVYAGLLYLGLSFVAANLGAVLLGIGFSFRTQGTLVFKNRDRHRIFRFALCWLTIWIVNILLIAGLLRLGLNTYVAGAVALVPITLISYLTQKWLVFSDALIRSTKKTAG